MDNNKIVDNLNFIKIYFRVFIYKIIVPEKSELSRKEIKILEYGLKTRLSTRTGSRKPKKGVQNTPEHESVTAPKSTIRHFFGLWPNSFWVSIRHTLFDFFAQRRVLICILLVVAYFLSIPSL